MKKIIFILLLILSNQLIAQHYYLLAGTYTGGGSKGLYVYDFDAATGKVSLISNTDSADNPSYLCISPDGNFVYAVNEVNRQQSGLVAAYRFNKTKGTLQFINRQLSGSENPCHISISRDAKWLLIANYTGGSLAALPIASDGSILPLEQHIIHTGKSVNEQRQENAHVHSVFLSPDEKFLLTPDLGTDQVGIYHFNGSAKQPLAEANPPYVASAPGSGPRHLEFTRNGKFVYVVEELSGTVTAYSFNKGKMKKIASYAGHLPGAITQHGSADIHLSPDEKFLYMSNRGDENNLAIFSVDAKSGFLTPAGITSTLGNHPRNFLIDPTGNYLLVGNMKSNEVVIFKRNQATGQLTESGRFAIPSPSCLKMLAK
ncbi:MAG: lactonase family protein [Chitinophagia bacterium]